jgi:hypothetical protein
VCRADFLTTIMCRLSCLGASNSWNPQDLSRVVIGVLYHIFITVHFRFFFLILIEDMRSKVEKYNRVLLFVSIKSDEHAVSVVKHKLSNLQLYIRIQGVAGGMCQNSGECSLGQTIPI